MPSGSVPLSFTPQGKVSKSTVSRKKPSGRVSLIFPRGGMLSEYFQGSRMVVSHCVKRTYGEAGVCLRFSENAA